MHRLLFPPLHSFHAAFRAWLSCFVELSSLSCGSPRNHSILYLLVILSPCPCIHQSVCTLHTTSFIVSVASRTNMIFTKNAHGLQEQHLLLAPPVCPFIISQKSSSFLFLAEFLHSVVQEWTTTQILLIPSAFPATQTRTTENGEGQIHSIRPVALHTL